MPAEQKGARSGWIMPIAVSVIASSQAPSVWAGHTEHSMQLPAEEEDNEQLPVSYTPERLGPTDMMRIPESAGVKTLASVNETDIPLKVCPSLLLPRKPDHHAQGQPHDPSGDTWTSRKVELEKPTTPLPAQLGSTAGDA